LNRSLRVPQLSQPSYNRLPTSPQSSSKNRFKQSLKNKLLKGFFLFHSTMKRSVSCHQPPKELMSAWLSLPFLRLPHSPIPLSSESWKEVNDGSRS
jgi:hypothetical protein